MRVCKSIPGCYFKNPQGWFHIDISLAEGIPICSKCSPSGSGRASIGENGEPAEGYDSTKIFAIISNSIPGRIISWDLRREVLSVVSTRGVFVTMNGGAYYAQCGDGF